MNSSTPKSINREKMAQISANIRLLLSSANRHPFSAALFSFAPFSFNPRKLKQPLFITFSKNSSKNSLFKRNQTTLSEAVKNNKDNNSNSEKKVKVEEMRQEPVAFNKKRAEGNDGQKKNLQRKVRKLNPSNTLAYVQILGTGMDTQDTSPSVLLFFDKQRFIFNAGEGLQRFCSEHKIKLSKIDHIFLSRVCSETAGGLPGLLLTLAGTGDEGMSVNVWGSSDLKYLVDAMKIFVPNAAMVHTHSFGPGLGNSRETPIDFDVPLVLIDDEVVKISALLLRPRHLKIPESTERNDPHDLGGSPKSENSSRPGDLSVVYLCELPEIKGKFDPAKAKALGLRAGPKYSQLKQAVSEDPVESDDHKGKMVYPSDVMGPSVPGPIVFLVDCPTLMHLEELSSLKCLTPYYIDTAYNAPADSKIVNCIIHLSPTHVTKTDDYQIWMSKFGGAQHIMAGHEKRNIEVPILTSSARIAARLNYLCPQFFPSRGFWSMDPTTAKASNKLSSRSAELIAAENLLKFHMRPFANLGVDRSSIPNLSSPLKIIEELLSEIPEIVDASKQVNMFWLDRQENNAEINMTEEPWLPENTIPSCLEDISREDMEIVLLGTGSSQPSKYRNVSSIFINLFSNGSILLDCGEGTLGQLKRRPSVKYKMSIRYLMEDVPKFGIEGADEAIRGLRCIWISHIHADHHTGLARILALRRDLLNGSPHEPIIVVGPWQLKRFLDAYQRLENLDMQFLDCRNTSEASLEALESSDDTSARVNESVDSTLFVRGSRMQSYSNAAAIPILKSLKKILAEAGLESLISFPVVHCSQSFGVALEASSRVNSVGKTIPGWKIVYSGDTRPCPKLVEAACGATVLIHEATFEDSLVDEAIAKNHSTTTEAIETGDAAGVYRIILTHFSQRYPKIPVFDETHMHKTCIAFDLMSINMADIHVLPKVLPHIKLLFRDDMIVDEPEDVDLELDTTITLLRSATS